MFVSQRSSSITRWPPLMAASVPPEPPEPKPVRKELAPSRSVPSFTARLAPPVAVPVPRVGAITSVPPFRLKMASTLLMLHSPV